MPVSLPLPTAVPSKSLFTVDGTEMLSSILKMFGYSLLRRFGGSELMRKMLLRPIQPSAQAVLITNVQSTTMLK